MTETAGDGVLAYSQQRGDVPDPADSSDLSPQFHLALGDERLELGERPQRRDRVAVVEEGFDQVTDVLSPSHDADSFRTARGFPGLAC